jgi:predicted RNA-binding Zn ribbon-like protein
MTYWPGDDESKPAPAPLARIQALVNTVERPDGRDRLADPSDARPWLVEQHLLSRGAALRDADLAMIRDVREAFRVLLVHNSGGPSPTAAELKPLRDAASKALARAEFDAGGQIRLSAAGESVAERLIELLLIMRDAQRDGSWARLKACGNDECHWAFYDKSRNHGGTWCEMSTCGNKLKNREFRARQRRAANG